MSIRPEIPQGPDRPSGQLVSIDGAVKHHRFERIVDHDKLGESHVLIGRNGAGKSTFVSVRTGLRFIDSATFILNGRAPPALSDRVT